MSSKRSGTRFEFGRNWHRFLAVVSHERIGTAEQSLRGMLAIEDLRGKTFLDIGSGSGLFSLAARRLGARVRSFDVDPFSVACTTELKQQHFRHDSDWHVEEGSVLDQAYLKTLGTFDVVYSWGVLHHTGSMWATLENVVGLVERGGLLVLAIYNDQGRTSRYWLIVKRLYNSLPRPLRFLVLWPAFLRLWGPSTVRDCLVGRPFHTWRTYQDERGMSPWRDVVDWVGGYPFEVAKPEEIFDFCCSKGFALTKMRTCGGGHGCNEFVFHKCRDVE